MSDLVTALIVAAANRPALRSSTEAGVPDPQPKCRRSGYFLGEAQRSASGAFTCPGFDAAGRCPGGESYVLQVGGSVGRVAVENALGLADTRFHRTPGGTFEVWMMGSWAADGEDVGPRRSRATVTVNRSGDKAIYLIGPTSAQIDFQAAHEAFHLLFTPGTLKHWTHEVAAVLFRSTPSATRAGASSGHGLWRTPRACRWPIS